jgi:hypothetical protein
MSTFQKSASWYSETKPQKWQECSSCQCVSHLLSSSEQFPIVSTPSVAVLSNRTCWKASLQKSPQGTFCPLFTGPRLTSVYSHWTQACILYHTLWMVITPMPMIFFIGATVVWTQVFMQTKQVLYWFSHTPSPFSFWVSVTYLFSLDSACNPPHLSLLSYKNYWYEPPATSPTLII